MSPIDAVRAVLRQYATFSGRARRSEYWWWVLARLVALVALVAVALLVIAAEAVAGEPSALVTSCALLFVILYLALVLPTVAVVVRRLHDTGASGWWYLLSFVPFGSIVLLVLLCGKSGPTANRWGPSPRAEDVLARA